MDELAPHRKLLKRREVSGHARYLTLSCYQRLPLFDNDAIKDAFVERLIDLQGETPFELFAWVVMPEHVHLLVRTPLPELPISRFVHTLRRVHAERVLRRWDALGAPILTRIVDSQGKRHFWQAGGGYDRNIFSRDELLEKVGYIHMNPVVRGLCNDLVDWKWSSAAWYAGSRGSPPRICDLPIR